MTAGFIARVTAKATARLAARRLVARQMAAVRRSAAVRRTAVAMAAAMVTGEAAATPAFATPDLRQGRAAGVLTVYPDDARRTLFYYPPGELTIAVAQDGAPDVHLLHARYTGSAATGDRGAKMVRSIFTLRLVMNGPTPLQLTTARRELMTSLGGAIELRPLPIRRLESAVVYADAQAEPLTPAGAPAARNERGGVASLSPQAGRGSATLPAGHVEESNAPRPRDGYWTERVYTLGLDATDAQLLSEALERGSLVLSVGYAFLADGIGSNLPLQELTSPSPRLRGEGRHATALIPRGGGPAWGEGAGSPELVDALRKQLEAGASKEPASGPHVVRAGAVAVTVDVKRWPRIVQRIDINDAAPPGYAALDVYCYDFNQGGESPLYEKQIEIDAAGIGGRRVQLKTAFSRAQPDLFARSLRFPVAVRLDKPYRFRVHEIARDGSQKTSEWREQPSWAELLDVTTRGEIR